MRPQLFLILAVTLSVTGTEYGRRPPTEPKAFLQLGSSDTVPANDYSAPNTWLCRPEIKGACNVDMTTTVVAASGALTRESWTSNANAPIDCFYVYPTVSTDPTPNSDMNPGAAELNVIRQQFARFGSVCRLYAPVYRQITLAGLRPLLASGTAAPAFEHGLQYDDVRDAWNYYLEHENGGRGFVLIGHSQGAFILTTLIRNEIDGTPVSSRMVSAILIGTTLTIPRGRDVGGTFQHVPLCRSPSATRCVITYASFRSTVPPPANTLFGKVADPNMVAACTNPAALNGGSGELHAYLDATGEWAHRGYLTAFDAKTGKVAWRFYTIPAPGEPGSETWPGDSWKTGGGSTWFTGSYDPELNLIYWGIGNPSSDFFGEHRKGSNLYTDSLVALDADTGKLRWYFQEIPHDLWDFDSNPEPVLIDVNQNGQTRKLVLHSSKGGYAYLLDRETGKLLKTFPYVQDVNWSGGLEKDGKPMKPVVPAKGSDFMFCPGALGGRNFNHSAYSPRTGFWHTNDFEFCGRLEPEDLDVKEGDRYFGGTMPSRQLSSKGKPNISAFDPLTGERKWMFATKYPNASSLLATAGDLIFAGDLEGYAFALDAKTGEKLWSFNTGAKIAAPPVSFSVNGRQYIAISTGGGSIVERSVPDLYPEAKGHLPADASTVFVFALPPK